jgi:hypothetical protein
MQHFANFTTSISHFVSTELSFEIVLSALLTTTTNNRVKSLTNITDCFKKILPTLVASFTAVKSNREEPFNRERKKNAKYL